MKTKGHLSKSISAKRTCKCSPILVFESYGNLGIVEVSKGDNKRLVSLTSPTFGPKRVKKSSPSN